jgi:hypothetical protein
VEEVDNVRTRAEESINTLLENFMGINDAELGACVQGFLILTEKNRADCTDKKENQIFLIYKEILSGAVTKSYMRKGFLIYEEMRKYFPIYHMRRPKVVYDFATAPL